MKKIFQFIAVLLFTLMAAPTISFASANKAAADGSFIQPQLCVSWTEARWQKEFEAMKNAGMHYLILQFVAESSPNKVTITYYPSSLPNTEMAKGSPDMVDACLKNAEAAGIKVFIGIDMSDKWWNLTSSDSTWLYNQMEFDNKLCDELWSLYKSKYPNAFHGWYWAYEVDNVRFTSQTNQQILIKGMNIQLDHLVSANEKLPFIWSPFMNSKYGRSSAYQTMWKNVFAGLHTTAGDIFCPQDCIGSGGLNLGNVAGWFSALRQAVDTKPGLIMWSDVETFEIYQDSYISATMDLFISQLKLEQPSVDNYVTFAYCHYYSPNNIDSGFQATYIDYLKTGSLETSAPSIPSNFTVTLQSNGDVALNWDASVDNIGVCGYVVYRDGTMIYKNQVPQLNGSTGNNQLTGFTDKNLSPNTTYTYQVKAYDFANNFSDATPLISVTRPNISIISHGCAYTFSASPDPNYSDPGNKKLTDGLYSSKAYYANSAWVGFPNSSGNDLDVIIDLGKISTVQFFTASYLLDPQPAVYLPKEVKVSVSSDNSTFANVGILNPIVRIDSLAAMYKYYYTASSPIDTRYVKFKTKPGGYWTFCDELEVGYVEATSIKDQHELPESYSLQQNYPNPFNSSTTINYQLPANGFVTLKIFDPLGREVASLVNEFQTAGYHSILFDTQKNVNSRSLPSGAYLYRLSTANFSSVKKLVLLK